MPSQGTHWLFLSADEEVVNDRQGVYVMEVQRMKAVTIR